MYDREIVVRGLNNDYEYFIDYNHPLATGNSGRVYVHRHNASIYRGKWLSKEEQVHHIDGDKLNNHYSNLLICSAAEHTNIHRGRNEDLICKTCNNSFHPTSSSQVYCSKKCSGASQVINKSLTKELLDSLIPNNTWTSLGKLFGYSDVGIKKRAKSLGCIIPERVKKRA